MTVTCYGTDGKVVLLGEGACEYVGTACADYSTGGYIPPVMFLSVHAAPSHVG